MSNGYFTDNGTDWGDIARAGMETATDLTKYYTQPSSTASSPYASTSPLWEYLGGIQRDYIKRIEYDLGFDLGGVTRQVFSAVLSNMAGSGAMGAFMAEAQKGAEKVRKIPETLPSYNIGVSGGPRMTGIKPLGAWKAKREDEMAAQGFLGPAYKMATEYPLGAMGALAPYMAYAPKTETMQYGGMGFTDTLAKIGAGAGVVGLGLDVGERIYDIIFGGDKGKTGEGTVGTEEGVYGPTQDRMPFLPKEKYYSPYRSGYLY